MQDEENAKKWLWHSWMLILWSLVLIGGVLWFALDRTTAELWLTIPTGWHLLLSAIPIIAFIAFQSRTALVVSRIEGPKPRLAAQIGSLVKIMPHTLPELLLFVFVLFTAGVCEELRGCTSKFLCSSFEKSEVSSC